MDKFHRLQVTDGVSAFIETDGESVELGDGVQAFRAILPSGEIGFLYDSTTGGRITGIADEGDSDLRRAKAVLSEGGLLGWHDLQLYFQTKYGRVPKPEIEILSHPKPLGLEICE